MGVSGQSPIAKSIPRLASTINYISARRCQSGGYCFYRLEEPNCADTYFALAALHVISHLTRDEKTAYFLLSRQKPDGSYESLPQAYFSIGGLRLLGLKPLHDPGKYLINHARIYDTSLLPAGINSIFLPFYFLAKSLRWLGLKLGEEERKRIISFVLDHQKEDGGFGQTRSTLMETRDAMVVLHFLGESPPAERVKRFLTSCEDETHGFVNVPGIRFSYLEHIQAGLTTCHLVSVPASYPEVISDFLTACRRVNGGYARTTHTGIASLENTYLALSSFQLLSFLNPSRR